VILLDTNFLIAALTPGSRQDIQFQIWLNNNEIVRTSIMVWAEFLCGPVTSVQVDIATSLMRDPHPILLQDAARGAELFNATGRRRGSLADCLIAASCLRLGAQLATENRDDFLCFERMGLRLIES
jgi:predicted nucleic acid-binding protein